MSTVQEIESAITQLKPGDVHVVADWLLEYREALWDEKIAADANAGKLDPLIKKSQGRPSRGEGDAVPVKSIVKSRCCRGISFAGPA